ncbi:MAG: HAD family phosphatase [Pleurocapsa sp. SU_196_0]|nr:HAD family phosphatase [Pleurocapsa sp. SU_196_0]
MLEFPFRAVLFDMDGTLTDNARFHTDAWLEFFKRRFAYDMDPADHRVHGGKTKFILESILERDFTDAEALELHLEKEALYRELASGQIQPVAGLQAYLEWLRVRDVQPVLVTSADATNTAFVLHTLGLEEVFAVRVLGSDVSHGNPIRNPSRWARLERAWQCGIVWRTKIPSRACRVLQKRARRSAGCEPGSRRARCSRRVQPTRLRIMPRGWCG